MSIYKGQTWKVPCNRGGWFPNPNADVIPPESMQEAENINLHNGGRETRGGVEKVNATPISGSPRIMGIVQFRKKNGNEFIVTATADGIIQKDFATVLKTGLSTNKIATFETFNDVMYIPNGANIPQTWDGVAATTSNLANPAADWSGSSFPKRMVKHGRGASERLWAFGAPNNLESVYASATGSDNFLTGVVKIPIETGDGFGIVAMEEFGDRLIAFGKRRAYLIEDTDVDTANWGYSPAQWEGGVGGLRLLAKTPNDLIAMSEDGEIYSVITTQQTGDYKQASITRPSFLHKWIESNVDLSKIDDFHMIYDWSLRAIKVFVVRIGQTKIDTALVFFIDRPPEEAWVQHLYAGLDSDKFASCSTLVRISAGNWKVYAGGHNGHAYKLESSILTDDGTYYNSRFLTLDDPFGNPRLLKRYDQDWLVLQPQGGERIGTNIYVDGRAIVGDGFQLVDQQGNFIVDESGNNIASEAGTAWIITPTAGTRLVNEPFRLGVRGIRKQVEVNQLEPGKKMFISQILSDHTPLGPLAGKA